MRDDVLAVPEPSKTGLQPGLRAASVEGRLTQLILMASKLSFTIEELHAMSAGGIFNKDNRIDDKARRDAVPGVMAQRVPAPPVAVPMPAPAPVAQAQTAVPGIETGSKLIVGPNIKLKSAEITDCDTLVVEGHVDGTVTSKAIQIAQTGTLNGTATIDNAEIHGEFKGELTVRKRLMICSTGKVTGKIVYGKLVIEEGGELIGEIQAMHNTGPALLGNTTAAAHGDAAPVRTGTPMPSLAVPSRH
jgi:cytoskeletal protein CcmA (bactofilin family)